MTTQSPYRNADPLGAALSEHSVAGVQQAVRVVLGVFSLLVAVDCVWLGVGERTGDMDVTGSVVCGIMTLVFGWLTWYSFSEYAKARKQRVTCHEYGLRIHDPAQHQDVRFDDVTSVGGMLWESLGTAPPAGTIMWVDDVQGARIVLPMPLGNAYELGEQVRRSTFEKRYSAARTRISSGEEARFGRCTLGALVLIVDGEIIPRTAIDKANLSSRWLAIKSRGTLQRLLPTEQVPDLDVMLSLLEG